MKGLIPQVHRRNASNGRGDKNFVTPSTRSRYGIRHGNANVFFSIKGKKVAKEMVKDHLFPLKSEGCTTRYKRKDKHAQMKCSKNGGGLQQEQVH
mmetsp:Transcript_21502/g.40151  ORF Transcript_21502/g.40151 Transcript_21502/m.40151 type:complete len:95 (+) Transcript_21502:135-419(+)